MKQSRVKLKHRTADTRTLKGLKYAEWLHTHGWKIIKNGFFTVTFEKKTSANPLQ